ncbi:MAG: hypothetical protein ACTIMA_04325 [Brachybacterium tyrofermentans]|uniref:Uncharacterized protein n=1 Tax=Brachybacterium tyrofermentans TaxID=47848 RepID=A0ABW0FIG7_9MICO|nr:hypothetical protein [Brachybacterium tyrofermentans]SLN01618.1 hypothetical protein FM103_10135 [Corynebacterium xerosis]
MTPNRAAVMPEIGTLEIRDVPVPTLAPFQALVSTEAGGLPDTEHPREAR